MLDDLSLLNLLKLQRGCHDGSCIGWSCISWSCIGDSLSRCFHLFFSLPGLLFYLT